METLNQAINSSSLILLESLYRVHPQRLDNICYNKDVFCKLLSQYFLSMALKQQVFHDTRGDAPGEGNLIQEEAERAIAAQPS